MLYCHRALFPLIVCSGLALSSCSRPAEAGKGAPDQRKHPAVPVRIASVTRQDVPLELRAIGNVEALSSVAVKSRVAGHILKVHIVDGAEVKPGDLLFEIDQLPFIEKVRAAEAAIARDQAAEKQSIANIARSQAQAANARSQAQRYETLFREGIGAREQAEVMRTTADAAEAQVNADRASLDSARAALRADDANLNQAKLDLGYTRITAPIAGRVGFVSIKEGNLVKENDVALVTILQISPAWVVFSVPEQSLNEIRRALAARTLPIDAVEEPSGRIIAQGRLEVIDNAVDVATGTIKLKARFPNADRRLWPGEFANVRVHLRTETGVLTVPLASLQSGPNGRYVWIMRPDSTAEQRPVQVSRTQGDIAVIEKGVTGGERVVTSGQLRVAPGTPLQILAEATAQ